MARIKIIQPGWEGFTGDIGQTAFEDGVSVEHVTQRQINIIGASLTLVTVDEDGDETGEDPRVQHALITETALRAPVLEGLAVATDADMKAGTANLPDASTVVFHTQAELETIASAKGLAGLREITDALNVKARSINEAIRIILKTELKLKAQMEANGELPRADAVPAPAESDEVVEGEEPPVERTAEELAAEADAQKQKDLEAAKAAEAAKSQEPPASKGDAGPAAPEKDA